MNPNIKRILALLTVLAVLGVSIRYSDAIVTALIPVAEFSARLVTGALW